MNCQHFQVDNGRKTNYSVAFLFDSRWADCTTVADASLAECINTN